MAARKKFSSWRLVHVAFFLYGLHYLYFLTHYSYDAELSGGKLEADRKSAFIPKDLQRSRKLQVVRSIGDVGKHDHASLRMQVVKKWKREETLVADQKAAVVNKKTQGKIPHQENSNSSTTRKWAYAFVVGGCGPNTPEYRGFIYNIAVAGHMLRSLGSVADVVAMIQISYSTNDTELPEEETKLLTSAGVRIRYIPKFASEVHENFYTLMMEKFRILDLTEYSRVLFLDSDIMPLCSLDYLFDLSEPKQGVATLKENLVLAWKSQPASGGSFMLRPSHDDFEALQGLIIRREREALKLPWPHWNPVKGWGHIIEPSDAWRSPYGYGGTNWTWHGSFADQGLLYYWAKYFKQNFSLVIKDKVENWGSQNGTSVLEETHKIDMLNSLSCIQTKPYNREIAPFRDFMHFSGKKTFVIKFSI